MRDFYNQPTRWPLGWLLLTWVLFGPAGIGYVAHLLGYDGYEVFGVVGSVTILLLPVIGLFVILVLGVFGALEMSRNLADLRAVYRMGPPPLDFLKPCVLLGFFGLIAGAFAAIFLEHDGAGVGFWICDVAAGLFLLAVLRRLELRRRWKLRYEQACALLHDRDRDGLITADTP